MSNQTLYVDPSYTAAITGRTHSITDEELSYGVNAFSALDDALPGFQDGDSLYVNGISQEVAIPGSGAVCMTDSAVPLLVDDPSGEAALDSGIDIVVKGSSFHSENHSLTGGLDSIDGNVSVLIEGTVIGDGGIYSLSDTAQLRLANQCAFGGKTERIDVTIKGSTLHEDINLLNTSTVGAEGKPALITMTLDHFSSPDDKWIWLTQSTAPHASYADIVLNIFDSELGTAGTMAVAVSHSNGAVDAILGDVTFNVRNTSLHGRLSPVSTTSYEKPGNPGKFTVNITGGASYIESLCGFDVASIAAGASLSAGTFTGNGKVYVSGELRATDIGADELHLLSGSTISGPVRIDADVFAEAGSTVQFDICGQLPDTYKAQFGDLSVFQDIPDFVLTISGLQENGLYTLAEGAGDFSKPITVRDYFDGSTLGTISAGESADFLGKNYTLECYDGILQVYVDGEEGGSQSLNDLTVNDGKVILITSGQSADGVTVARGGTFIVGDEAAANDTEVDFGGTMKIRWGGSASGISVNPLGTLVLDGGTIVDILENGGYVSDNGWCNEVVFLPNTLSGLIVSGGSASLHSNTTASDTTVGYRGQLHIFSGGTADRTTISSGGLLQIADGGSAGNTMVSSGGSVAINFNGSAAGLTVAPGGRVAINHGGSLDSVHISSGGTLTVSGGGVLSSFSMDTGAVLTVSNGGTVYLEFDPWLDMKNFDKNANIYFFDRSANVYYGNSRTGLVSAADSMSSMTVHSGNSLLVYSGGQTDDIRVGIRGILQVSEGGIVRDTVVDSGGSVIIDAYGTATRIVENGGYVTVKDGAEVTFAPNTISGLSVSGGGVTLHSGTSVFGLTGYYTDGHLYVYDGGFATDIDLYGWDIDVSGGTMENAALRAGRINVSSGATANGISLGSRTSMCVSEGGIASGITILKGDLLVKSGATATDIDWMPGQGTCTFEEGAVVTFNNDSKFTGVYYNENGELLSHTRLLQGRTIERYTGVHVLSGGTVYNNVLSAGGIFVSSGGTANMTESIDGGTIAVYEGGVANDAVLSHGFVLIVNEGGSANNISLKQGMLTVSGGGVVRNLAVEDGTWFTVSSGGTVTGRISFTERACGLGWGATLDFDLTETAPDADPLVNILNFYTHPLYSLTVSGSLKNGRYLLAGDASTFNNTITVKDIYGKELGAISLGETKTFLGADYTLNLDDGILSVTVSGSAMADTVAPKVFNLAGDICLLTDRDVTVTAEFSDDVELADTFCRIGESGEWTAYAGGVTVSGNTVVYFKAVDAAGNESEIAGYTVSNIRKNPADVVSGLVLRNDADAVFDGKRYADTTLDFNGWLYISGGTATGTTVNGMGKLFVSSGGTATGTTVNDVGLVMVEPGAVVTGATVNDGGRIYIQSGASYNDVTVNSGGSVALSGSIAHAAVHSGGYLRMVSGANVDGLTADFGAFIFVDSDCSLTNVRENGGCISSSWGVELSFVPNTFSGQVISSGSATLHSGTTALDTTVASTGAMYVFDGGRISNTTLENYGSAYVSGGAAADGVRLNNFGSVFVSSGGTALNILENGGCVTAEEGAVLSFLPNTLSGLTIKAQSATLHSGTVFYDIAAEVFGNVLVYDGGYVERAMLNEGQMVIHSGGSATNLVVNNNTSLIISGGGAATDILVTQADDYNFVVVAMSVDGGTASRTTLRGKFRDVSARSFVRQGGVMIDTLVDFRGFLHVSSGGAASDTVVLTSGYLGVSSGGTAKNATVSSGGTMYAAAGGMVTGRMTFDEHASVDLDGAVLNFDVSGLAPNPNAIVNNLSVVTGLPEYVITVGDGQTNGTYLLARGADGFGDSITVRNTHDKTLGTVVAGQSLQIGSASYGLNLDEGNLTLTVSGSVAPPPDTVAPTISNIRANTTAPTNWDVVVTADFDDDVELESALYRIGESGEWTKYSGGVSVSGNTTVHFLAVDISGNTAEASYMVGNIDKVPPAQPVASADVTEVTAGEVRVSAEFSEDSVSREYRISYSSYDTWLPYDGAVVLTMNGDVTFRAIDSAGNSSFAIYEVRNIDQTAPFNPQAYADVTDHTNGEVHVTAEFGEDSVFGEYSFDGENWLAYTGPVVFTENGTVYFRGKDSVGNYSPVTSYTVSNIDTEPPAEPEILVDKTEATNRDVTVSAVFSADSTTNEYSLDGENWLAYTGPVVFTENGTVYFRGADLSGNYSGTVCYTVDNIDKVAPDAPSAASDVQTTGLIEGTVNVSAVFPDDAAVKEYSFDGMNWHAYEGAVPFTFNGMVYFRCSDAAGNLSDVTPFEVRNFTVAIPEKPSVSADVTEATNGDVLVSAVFSADSARREYSLDGENWIEYTGPVRFAGNGFVLFRGTNEAGVPSEVSLYEVNNIDKVPPAAPVAAADITELTNNDVLVTATFSEDSVMKEYSRDGENWLAYTFEDGILMQENGTLFFRAADAVGNVSEVTSVVVDYIDKILPAPPLAVADITERVNNRTVTVTATFSEDSVIRVFRIDGEEEWKPYTGPIAFEDNGAVYFRGIDAAGNESDETRCEVNNISHVSVVDGPDQNGKNDSLLVNGMPKALDSINEVVEASGEIFVDQEFSVDVGGYHNCVGVTDKADFARIKLDKAAKLSFTVVADNKVKFTLYRLVENKKKPGTYTQKALKSVSVSKAGQGKSTASVLVEGGSDNLYYVAVENKSKNEKVFYNVSINTEAGKNRSCIYADGDDGWNNGALLVNKEPSLRIKDFLPLSIAESGKQAVLFDTNGITAAETDGDWNNFVGFGDDSDYVKLSVIQPAKLGFTVTATDNVKLVVYKLTKGAKWSQTAVKSMTVSLNKAEKAAGLATRTVELNLERLIGREDGSGYYVSVQSTNAKSGGKAWYNVSVDSVVYAADCGTNNVLLDGAQIRQGLVRNEVIGANVPLSMEVPAEKDDVEVGRTIGSRTFENFVGFGDEFDYAEVRFDDVGACTFSVETWGTQKAASKFTVYKLTLNKGKWSKKSLGTITVKNIVDPSGGYASGAGNKADVRIDAVSGDTVRYFVSMQSVDAKKGKEVYYNVFASFSGTGVASALEMPESESNLSLQDELFAGLDSVQDVPLSSVDACLDSASDKLLGESGGILAGL